MQRDALSTSRNLLVETKIIACSAVETAGLRTPLLVRGRAGADRELLWRGRVRTQEKKPGSEGGSYRFRGSSSFLGGVGIPRARRFFLTDGLATGDAGPASAAAPSPALRAAALEAEAMRTFTRLLLFALLAARVVPDDPVLWRFAAIIFTSSIV